MNSNAVTVEQYLDELPEDRRDTLTVVRNVILANLPEGIVETIRWGMISYEIPLELYPNTYNGQPLNFASLASQKNHMAIYLCAIYADETLKVTFEDFYTRSGKRLDAGKACVRFKNLDGIDLDAVAYAIGSVTAEQFCDMDRAVHDKTK